MLKSKGQYNNKFQVGLFKLQPNWSMYTNVAAVFVSLVVLCPNQMGLKKKLQVDQIR